MNSTPKVAKEELPERLVVRLARRMARQDLYDSLLMVFPPLGASLYLLLFSGFASRNLGSITLAAAALLAAGLLVRMGVRRAAPPRVFVAARLLDERVDGKERFMTLATLGSSTAPFFLMERLRQEAARLGARVDLGRDFPYRLKHSFLVSLIASLIIVLGFRLWPPMASRGSSDPARVRQAAKELSRIPHLAEWARTLQALADRLQDKHLSADEKRQLVQETLKKIENQSEQSRQGKGSDALGQAKEILQGVERELGKSQGQGGELKTNLPQDGKGKGKGSGSGGGSGDDQKSAALSKKDSGEAGANRPEQGTEQKSGEGGQGGEKKGGEGGKSQEGKKELEGKVSKEDGKSGGKSKVGEEIPKGSSPEPYGETAGAGLKDGRFVTVQLPEEETGKSTGASDSEKRREVRPKVPLGNVPLGRPDARDALPERQHLPLEYRGMIR